MMRKRGPPMDIKNTHTVTINGLYRDELDQRLYDLIDELKNKFGIEGRLTVIIREDNPPYKPNLFGGVSPRSIDKFHIVYDNELTITRGIFRKINIKDHPDELKTLIAHEFSHICNKDQFISFILQIVWFGSSIFIFSFVSIYLKNIVLTILISLIYFVLVGRFFYSWRRGIENRCDSDSVKMTENPDATMRALKKMDIFSSEIKNIIQLRDKPLFFLKKAYYFILGNTHPSISERIKNVESIGKIKRN